MSSERHLGRNATDSRNLGRSRRPNRASSSAFSYTSRKTSHTYEHNEFIERNSALRYRIQSNDRRRHLNSGDNFESDPMDLLLPPIKDVGIYDRAPLKQKSSGRKKSIFRETKLPYLPTTKMRGSKNEHYKIYKDSYVPGENSDFQKTVLPSLKVMKINPGRKVAPNLHLADEYIAHESPYYHQGRCNNDETCWRSRSPRYQFEERLSTRNEPLEHNRHDMIPVQPEKRPYYFEDAPLLDSQIDLDRGELSYDPFSHWHDVREVDLDPFLDRCTMNIPGLQPRQSTTKRINDWLRANEALKKGAESKGSSRKTNRTHITNS